MPDDRLDEHFSLGLHNIRRAIEARLEASGMERQSLGDTSRGSKRAAPGMVIIDVGANNKIARVTFTREEVEDCTRAVDAYCVRSKIDHVVGELMRERRSRRRY
jgi:chloramphenicol 3-O-phosphotransferase